MSNLLVQNIKHTNNTQSIAVDTSGNVTASGTIAVDTIKGNASAGSISVVGEGGSTTTNLQQGLAKCFIRTDTPGTTLTSFNVSSNTDVDTGQHRSAYTNNMSASKNSCTAAGCEGAVNTNTLLFEITTNESSSQVEGLLLVLSGVSSQSITDGDISISVFGDLA